MARRIWYEIYGTCKDIEESVHIRINNRFGSFPLRFLPPKYWRRVREKQISPSLFPTQQIFEKYQTPMIRTTIKIGLQELSHFIRTTSLS